ncbi:Thioredoxin domain-containing protein 11 [Homalodisca vitripennis]|nr:Thioredoxin domain-containing protein 11 [Homalodisca vitripennis]
METTHVLDGSVTRASLSQFLVDFVQGKLERFQRSQASCSSSPELTPVVSVTELTTETFIPVAFNDSVVSGSRMFTTMVRHALPEAKLQTKARALYGVCAVWRGECLDTASIVSNNSQELRYQVQSEGREELIEGLEGKAELGDYRWWGKGECAPVHIHEQRGRKLIENRKAKLSATSLVSRTLLNFTQHRENNRTAVPLAPAGCLRSEHLCNNVVVMFHSPYCAFCHAVGHVYLTTAQILRQVPTLVFARVDGENNDLPWQFTAPQYPSVLFFPARRLVMNFGLIQ